MNTIENEFAMKYHERISLKYESLHIILTTICILSVVLALTVTNFPSFTSLFVVIFVTLPSWLGSVKVKSLSNIHRHSFNYLKNMDISN